MAVTERTVNLPAPISTYMPSAASSASLMQRLLAIVSSFLLGVGGLFLGFVLLLITAVTLITLGVEISPGMQLVMSLVFVQGIGCVLVALTYVRNRERISAFVHDRLGFEGEARPFSVGFDGPNLTDGAVAIGAFVAAFVGGPLIGGTIAGVVVQYLGEETGQNAAVESGLQNPELLLLMIPASILIVGPGEELLFRGVVQGRLREVFGPALAIGLAGTVFAAIHWFALSGGTPTGNLVALSVLLVPSFVFGISYEYTNNILVPSLAHGLYNATLFSLVYLFAVYGDALDEVAILFV